ncbi:MAG: GNAT family N-acyltransferase [Prosthecobacter sp.]
MSQPRLFVDSAALLPPGPARSMFRLIRPLLERACGFHRMNEIYAKLQVPGMTPERFCREGLSLLNADVRLPTDAQLAPLREWRGPLVVMSNHPFGGTEALAFMLLLERLRPGAWRMFANAVLAGTPELAPHLIAVDPFSKAQQSNRAGIAQARRWLQDGGLLGAFPAGRVSGWDEEFQAVLDQPWSDHPARLAAAAGAAVAVVHVPGSNSELFLNVPLRWPRLRALFLPHEMLRRSKPAVRFDVGPVTEPATVKSLVRGGRAGMKFRARCHLLPEIGRSREMDPKGDVTPPEIAPPGDAEELRGEVEALAAGANLLFEQGRYVVLRFQRFEALALFHELSRLREITFRAAGQGGGAAVDITPEDDYYHQVILWDREQSRLVGSYRMGLTEEVIRERGHEALYLSHVFHMDPAFFDRIGPAVELTRSFVHPDYQKEPLALALLWKGVCRIMAEDEGVRSVFGSVTTPATVSDASRAVIVEYLRRHHSEDESLRRLVRARRPFQAPGMGHRLIADAHDGEPIETLRDVIRAPDGTPCVIPPLIRHYLSLNARFIDFHVERDFGDALYSLLRVDLTKMPRPHLRRFFGPEVAERLAGKSG